MPLDVKTKMKNFSENACLSIQIAIADYSGTT
jgi:hypothetical protein